MRWTVKAQGRMYLRPTAQYIMARCGSCAGRTFPITSGAPAMLPRRIMGGLAAMERQLGGDPEGKMRRLLDFTRHPRDIDDPWYTGDFVTAYRDIEAGCAALLDEMFPGSGEKKR